MSGGNVTIVQFASTTAPVAGDSFAAYKATASATVRFLATQIVAYVFSTDIAYTNQTVATTVGAAGTSPALPSTPSGYLAISINGTAYKMPFFTA